MSRRRSIQLRVPGARADSSHHDHTLSRRRFLGLLAAAAGTQAAGPHSASAAEQERDVYVVPNFHPASCGWLTTFSRERVYCANSYLTHLDRVGTDPQYAFVLSEINNIVAIMNFRPERIAELKARIREQRVELVNGMFLEPTINLSGGEALVRMGVMGLRWYRQVFNIMPRYAWTIDVCGTHEQMAQIASGLGFDAMVYTRKNPTGKTMYWSVSPDGSKILTLSPGHYSEAGPIFSSKTPLTTDELQKLDTFFTGKERITPAGAPILILGGADDYSCAPVVKEYPSQFLHQWQALASRNRIRFSTLSHYVDAVLPGIRSGQVQIPTTHAGTAYDFDAFWIENPEVKTRYRAGEQALQAAEMLSTVARLGLGQVGDIGGDHRRGVFGHHYGLRLRARLQRGIQAPGLARLQQDLGQRVLLESRRGNGQAVFAHVDVVEGVIAVGAGSNGADSACPAVGERDLGAGHQRAACVAHAAHDGAKCRLGRQRRAGDRNQSKGENLQHE